MAFQRPTLTELISRIEADYVSRLVGGGSLLRRSVVKVLARVHAGAMHLLYGFVAWAAKQVMPDTADEAQAKRWAAIWGVTQKAATYSTFSVEFTGTNGTVIPDGTELSSADGLLYETTAEGTISAGVATVECIARDAGVDPTPIEDQELTLSSPIAGCDSTAVVQNDVVDGTDTETVEDLVARLLIRIQQPPNGGSENDYVQWALEVAGVTRAWCLPGWLGNGTVGVTFVRDDDSGSIIPSVGEVADVQDYIDELRPVTADLTVFAPTSVPLNFTIGGVASTTIRAAIQAELEDLIRREAEPGGTLLLSHIQEAISKAEGETDHTLTVPAANVTVTAGQLSTMGTITWA